MAEGTFWRSPDVGYDDTGKTVTVTLTCDGLLKSKSRTKDAHHQASNAECDVTFYNGGFSFEMKCKTNVGKGNKERHYMYKVNRLPKKIDTRKSEWRVEDNQIVVILVKEEEPNVSWDRILRKQGLECQSDSSSDDDSKYVPESKIKTPF